MTTIKFGQIFKKDENGNKTEEIACITVMILKPMIEAPSFKTEGEAHDYYFGDSNDWQSKSQVEQHIEQNLRRFGARYNTKTAIWQIPANINWRDLLPRLQKLAPTFAAGEASAKRFGLEVIK